MEPRMDRGAIFQREKRSDAAPDFTGDLVLGEDLIRNILDQARENGYAKIDLSAWGNKDRNKKTYFSIKAKKPFRPAGEKAPERPREPVISNAYADAKAEPPPWDM